MKYAADIRKRYAWLAAYKLTLYRPTAQSLLAPTLKPVCKQIPRLCVRLEGTWAARAAVPATAIQIYSSQASPITFPWDLKPKYCCVQNQWNWFVTRSSYTQRSSAVCIGWVCSCSNGQCSECFAAFSFKLSLCILIGRQYFYRAMH